MKHHLSVTSIVLLTFASLGCQSHSVRDGTWMLTFHAQDSRTQESIEPYLDASKTRVHQVALLVEWGKSQPGEVIEIRPISSHSQVGRTSNANLTPLYGEIRPDDGEVTVRGSDNSWEFRMVGRVESEEHIIGRKFLARMKLDDEAIEGRWSLKRVSD